MRLCARVAVERGVEVFEGFGLFGCKRGCVDEGKACKTGVEQREDFRMGERGGCAELIGSCYGCCAKVEGGEKSGEGG